MLVKIITLQVDFGPPTNLNDLQKLTDIQSILMYPSVVKVKNNHRVELNFKVVSAYLLQQSSDIRMFTSVVI